MSDEFSVIENGLLRMAEELLSMARAHITLMNFDMAAHLGKMGDTLHRYAERLRKAHQAETYDRFRDAQLGSANMLNGMLAVSKLHTETSNKESVPEYLAPSVLNDDGSVRLPDYVLDDLHALSGSFVYFVRTQPSGFRIVSESEMAKLLGERDE